MRPDVRRAPGKSAVHFHPMVNADSIFEDIAKLMLLSVSEMADTVLGAPVMTGMYKKLIF